MRRTIVLVLLVSCVALSLSAQAMGAGVFLGQPSGLSFGVDLAKTQGLDFKAAWNLGTAKGGAAIILQGNYELFFPRVLVIAGQNFVPFIGVGAQLAVADGSLGLGIHVPGGINWRPRTVPIELFLELGLDIGLFPATTFGGSGGLGVRYRF